MKSTGIVRKVDELGRIVLPMELRKMLDLNVKDPVEIFVDDERIILQKYYPACIFCGDADDIVYYNGKRICAKCLANMLFIFIVTSGGKNRTLHMKDLSKDPRKRT